MDDHYYFDYPNARIGLHPADMGAQHDQCQRCFLIDNLPDALIVQMRVGREMYDGKSPSCNKTLWLHKEGDYQPLLEACLRLNEWQYHAEDTAKSMRMNHESAANILHTYEQSYAQEADEYRRKAIGQLDFSYAMDSDKQEDTISLLLPIATGSLQCETPYRLMISNQGEVVAHYAQSPQIAFFHANKPVGQLFIPLRASIKVLPMKHGKPKMQSAVDYRSYDGYYDDVHYDDICQEVEVNPPLVCFEIVKDESLKWRLLPLFSITLTSGGKILNDDSEARFKTSDHRHYTLLTPMSGDYISSVGADGMVTATLRVFDTTIASFSFSVRRSEPGCHVFGPDDKQGQS